MPGFGLRVGGMMWRTWLCLALLLLLCLLAEFMPHVTAVPLREICGVDANWVCPKNIDDVPEEVIQVCEACQNYWGNVPGFAFCCRCSDRVFDFCWQAVIGGK